LINPIYWGESSVPPLAAFTPLDTDPIGDHLFTNSWLDITSSKVCFTQDRIFFAIKNNHTSFPVSSGLFTYFAYMAVLVNPASSPDENPIVFGLMYTVDVAGIMSPGLYKITGIGFNDLVRLGDIIYSIQDQTLILSCALSDLIADADFSSWYNPSYPLIATTITTSRITLASGTQQADLSAGAKLLLLPHHAQHQNLHTPVLSNAGYSVSTTPFYEFQVQIDFWDADGTFPDLAEVTIDDFGSFPLTLYLSEELSFATGARYKATIGDYFGDWDELIFTFSDGEGDVQYSLLNPVQVDDLVSNAIQSLQIYPNPFNQYIEVKSHSEKPTLICIYNLKGQNVMGFWTVRGEKTMKLDLSPLQSGIYFVQAGGHRLKRIVKL
jgi:hypothetical protein